MRTRDEESGRRIYINKKMVSEFGATLGCKCCFGDRTTAFGGVPGQDHYVCGERHCARESARWQFDQAQRIRQPGEAVAPNAGRTDAPKLPRRDEIEPPKESANTEESFDQLGWS